jgi:3-hydroxybutyryl-CoA dehydrogenase
MKDGDDTMRKKVIGVLGCGIMGSGIAEVCAKAGYETWVREINKEALGLGRKKIENSLSREVKKGSLTQAGSDEILNRFRFTTEMADMKETSYVVEAVIEDVEIKKRIFKELDDILDAEAVVASNTSSYSITELASVSKHPERVVGFHFFYPAPMMKLVEVVKTSMVSPQAIEAAMSLARSLGKNPVLVPDKPGFLVNRLLLPYYLDSIRVLEEGLASVEDIDKGMTEGGGFVIGPLRLLDHIGLDTIYSMANSFYNELREKKFAPPPLLKRMVLAGNLGRKTGKGFYEYKR